MGDGSSFGAPRSGRVLFKLDSSWPVNDYAFFIDHLIGNGVKPADVKQIDLYGKPECCVMTLSCEAAHDAFLSSNFKVRGREIPVMLDDGGEVISLHVFGRLIKWSAFGVHYEIWKNYWCNILWEN